MPTQRPMKSLKISPENIHDDSNTTINKDATTSLKKKRKNSKREIKIIQRWKLFLWHLGQVPWWKPIYGVMHKSIIYKYLTLGVKYAPFNPSSIIHLSLKHHKPSSYHPSLPSFFSLLTLIRTWENLTTCFNNILASRQTGIWMKRYTVLMWYSPWRSHPKSFNHLILNP